MSDSDRLSLACKELAEKMSKIDTRVPRLSWTKDKAFESVAKKSISRVIIAR